MNKSSQDCVAVLSVLGRIQNMLVPEIIEVARPRHDRLLGIADNEVKKLPIFSLHAHGVFADAPPPPFLESEFLPDRVKIDPRD